jgi:hypothetical protein
MRRLFDCIEIFGLACYGYVVLSHSIQPLEPGALILSTGIVIFLAGHHGRSAILSLARVTFALSDMLRRIGQTFVRVPEFFSTLWRPVNNDSSIDRRVREIGWERLIKVGFCIVVGALAVSLIKGSAIQDIRATKIEKLEPPYAPQPFQKRWESPNEPSGIGGPGQDDAEWEIVPPAAPPVAKRPRQQKVRPMSNPWDFPKF